VYIGLFLVAVLAGSALFVSGFTLGRQGALTPGTSDARQRDFEPFWSAFNKIDSQYVGEADDKKLVEGALKGMFQALGDPYSSYMTSEEYKRSMSSIAGQFEGIGATLTPLRVRPAASGGAAQPDETCPAEEKLSATCRLVVKELTEDAPAVKAGVRVGDVLVAVDGKSVNGQTFDEVIKSIRGPRDTTVTLRVRRGAAAPIEIKVVRAIVATKEVTSRVLAGGTIGYIRLDRFTSSSAAEFQKHLRTLVADKGLKRIIFDLRDDPGGFVNEAQQIASQFIGSGPIFWEEFADGRKQAQEAVAGGVATDPSIQLVLLVNGGSASATEIVAGALQDSGRARLVGEKTFGKGLVQEWHELSTGGGFSLSVKKWLTPKQTWIHGKGVIPDVIVARPADTPADKDPVLDRAVQLLTRDGATGLVLPVAA
jgi:carboxyl-terminal processing protease